MPCAEDGVDFSSIRVTHKKGAAAEADAEDASVWLTGTLGEKITPFTSAVWGRTGRNKGKRRTKLHLKLTALMSHPYLSDVTSL